MKILAVGDLQFQEKGLKDVAEAWKRYIDLAHERKVDIIVQAGDVFDRCNVYGRKATTGSIYKAFTAPFLREKPIPLYCVLGNHEISNTDQEDALSPIDAYPWINVFRTPSITTINDNFAIAGIPWISQSVALSKLIAKGIKPEEALSKIKSLVPLLTEKMKVCIQKAHDEGKFVLLLGHCDVTGARTPHFKVNGELFEFSPAQLKEMNADAYCLGHIHMRQHIPGLPNEHDGYIGTLCQHSYEEQDYSVGIRVLTVENNKVVADKWIENHDSPKYYVCSSLDGLEYRPNIDKITLKSEVKPDEIPDGISFQKLPTNNSKRGLTEVLDCNTDLKKLLATWKKTSNVDFDIDHIHDLAANLIKNINAPSDSIGSLDYIERISLKNINSHINTTIDLQKSTYAFCGDNGAGKSTALDAVIIALYGIPPKNSTQSYINSKASSASIELIFSSNKQKYLVRREFKVGKTFGHKAFLFKYNDDETLNDSPIATGADAVNKECKTIVGSPEMLLSGIFAIQGQIARIIAKQPSERKEVFAQLNGTQKFLVYANEIKKLVTESRSTATIQSTKIQTIKDSLVNEQMHVDNLSKLQNKLIENKTKQKDNKEAIAELQKDVDINDSIFQKVEKAAHTINLLIEDRDQIKIKGKKITNELNDIKLPRNQEIIQKEIDELQPFIDEIKKLDEEIQSKTEQSLKNEKEKSLKRQELLNKRETFKNAAVAAINELTNLKNKQEDLKSRISIDMPSMKECLLCPLTQDILKAKKEYETITSSIEIYKEKVDSTKNAVEEYDLSAKQEMQQFNITFNIDELKNKKQELMPKIKELNKLKTELDSIEEISNKKAKYETELAQLKQIYQDIEQKIVKEKESESMILKEFDARNPAKTEEKYNGLKALAETLVAEEITLNNDIGKLTAYCEQHTENKKTLAELKKSLETKNKEIADYEIIIKAFDKNGIPQLIVEGAIPHLQDIMAELIGVISKSWTIEIETQEETKSGNVREEINIFVDDGDAKRDISTYSGGEHNLLSAVLRLAFSIIQSERTGKSLNVLVIDEGMFFADDNNEELFINILEHLVKQKRFEQVIIVSHQNHALGFLNNKIFFVNQNKETKIINS